MTAPAPLGAGVPSFSPAGARTLSVIFDITHTTHYTYARPVTFGEHRILFRPRDSHDLRVLATDLHVSPLPVEVRLVHDVYSNSIALVRPHNPSTELKVVSMFTVEHTGTRALDLPLDPAAECWPFAYSPDDEITLHAMRLPCHDDPDGTLMDWARQFIRSDGPTGSRDLLVDMTRSIRASMQYVARDEEGVQSPMETLTRGSGTCRDFATLMIEAVRRLGYAARFVSGYLYSPSDEAGHLGAGATHAWLHVYLPGAGWLPFDPTNNLIGGSDLIRVAYARHASMASPVSGSWHGEPSDYIGMTVDVQVIRRDTP